MDPKWVSFFFFALAGIIHVGFFILESVLFQKPNGYHLFKMKKEEHMAAKVWAFNQGFYNLFLAIGTFIGLFLVRQHEVKMAGLMTGFCGFCMISAGVVLWFSAPHLRRGALVQILPPLLGFFFLGFHAL